MFKRNRDFIRTAPAFESFGEEDLDVLFHLIREKRIYEGEMLFEVGEASDGMYIVAEGSIVPKRPRLDERVHVLPAIGPGGIIGSIGFLDGGPRSATCVAAEDSLLFKLLREDVAHAFARGEPCAYRLLDILLDSLASQLRRTGTCLDDLVLANLGD